MLTTFYEILYVNKKFLLLVTFAIFAKIEFSLFFRGQKSQIRKNDILNFFVRKHTSLISMLTNLQKILTVNNNFLLLATFASFKIVFSKLRGQKVAGAKHFFLTTFGHFQGRTD